MSDYVVNISVLNKSIRVTATDPNAVTLSYVCSASDLSIFGLGARVRIKVLSDAQEKELPANVTDVSVEGVPATDMNDLITKLSVINFE